MVFAHTERRHTFATYGALAQCMNLVLGYHLRVFRQLPSRALASALRQNLLGIFGF